MWEEGTGIRNEELGIRNEICDNLWTIIQTTDVFFIDHRLTQIGTD